MVSQSALSLLPAIGYALLAALACWLVYRVILARRRRRDGTASASGTLALPNPVGVGSATRSAFSFARARARTGWDWHGWSLPWPRVPWSKSASKSGTLNSGKSNAKNLSVELLPTTGLPPHPASTPTPTGPLVDLTPPTPPLIPSASASTGPISPRTPSPSHYLAYKGIRSPSPHALLATTSPSKHKRSRSLGGVPVRRLSGGNSGLRNKVDFDSELEMRELDLRHTRGTSREGLLIDFSSSSSGSSSGSYPGTGPSSSRTPSESEDEDKTRISPAASDIGVLKLPGRSPSSPFSSSSSSTYTTTGITMPKLLPTRPVPLVDLSDASSPSPFLSTSSHSTTTTTSHLYSSPPLVNTHEDDDDAWKWFGPSTPSHVKIYTPQPQVQAWNANTWAPQIPVVPVLLQKERTEKEERLVDVDGPSSDEITHAHMHDLEWKGGRPGPLGQGIGQGFEPLDSSKTLVEFELDEQLKAKAYPHHHEDGLLVDVRPSTPVAAPAKGEVHLVDLHDFDSESSPAVAAVGLVPSPSPHTNPSANADARALSSREDPFSDAHSYAPAEPLVDVSMQDENDYEHEHEQNDPNGHHNHPYEDTTTLPLSLSLPLSHPQPVLGAPTLAPASAPAPAPTFVHHPLEDLVPIPIPAKVQVQVDSKPSVQPLLEIGNTQRAPDGGLLFSPSYTDSIESVRPLEVSVELSPLVSPEREMPMIDFAPAAGTTSAGAGAGAGFDVQGWKWDEEEEEEDPWAGHVVEGFKKKGGAEDSASDADLKSLPEPQSVVLSELSEKSVPTAAPKRSATSAPISPASEEEAETAPPSPPLPVILLDIDLLDVPATPSAVAEVAGAEVEEMEVHPDPELFPLPLPLPPQPLSSTKPAPTRPQIVIDDINICVPEPDVNSKPAASQTPTPPASPPPVSPLSLRVIPSGSTSPISLSPASPRPSPISPRPSRGNLRVVGERERGSRSRPVSPRVEGAGLPEDSLRAGSTPKPLWAVSTVERVELLSEYERETEVVKEVREAVEIGAEAESEVEKESALPLPEDLKAGADDEDEDEPPSPLPGSFPSSSPAAPVLSSTSSSTPTPPSTTSTITTTPSSTTANSTTTTIAARLAASAPSSLYRPSTRSIVRSPLDVALAMQLRPGLGLGADPAWMVRFLMAMWGWLAVVVSGQGGY